MFEDNVFQVTSTSKIFGSFYLHFGTVSNGNFSLGDCVKANIDCQKRDLIKCNHSSTHLLHSSLRKILGKHVSQKGSLVNKDKLRFDFSHNEIIKNNDIIKIESLVNKQINNNSKVSTKLLDHKKAINEGAIALFGEKYGDMVRVVSMGSIENGINYSKELCGGTHVSNLGNIKKFKIINQSSVASGIRRIEAITNKAVVKYIAEQSKLQQIKKDENIKKIEELIYETKKLDSKFSYSYNDNENLILSIKELRKILDSKIQNQTKESINQSIINEKINNINFVYLVTENYPSKSLKQFVDDQKNKFKERCVSLIISKNDEKVSIVLGATDDLTDNFNSSIVIQDISKLLGGSGGGGRKDLAQAGGSSLDNVKQAISKLKNYLNF